MVFQDSIRRLLRYELYGIVLLTLAAMTSQPLLVGAVGSILIGLGVRYLVRKNIPWFVTTPADLAIIALCLLLPLTWWITIDRQLTGWQILRLLNGIGLFYVVVYWLTIDSSVIRLCTTLVLFVGIGLSVVVIGLVSTKWPVGKSRGFDEIYAYLMPFSTSSIHPNVLAGTIVLFLPIAFVGFGLSWFHWRQISALPYARLWQSFHLTSMLVLTIGLGLTQSRGAFLGMIASIFAIFMIIGGKKLRLYLISGIILIALLGILFPTTAKTLAGQLTNDSAISTSEVRLEIWSRAYYIAQDFPFTGIGMGNFQQVVERMYPLLLTNEIIPHAHNLFLQIADDLGLIGLICWLAIVLSVTMSLCMVIRQEAGHRAHLPCLLRYLFATALLGSQVALLSHGLVDAVTWGSVRTAPFIWMLWGAALSLYLQKTHSAVESS